MDQCNDNDGNSSDSNTAQSSVSDMLDDSEQTQAAAGMENGNLEETGQFNQSSAIDRGDEDLQGAWAAGEQKTTLRSHYHDEENRKSLSGRNALGASSNTTVTGLDRAQCSSNAENIPWLQQVTIPDSEVTAGRPLAGAVSEETSNDSMALGQHFVERWVHVRRILSESEEFIIQMQRLEQWITEQRDVERMREERQAQQEEANAISSQQLHFSRTEPSQNCEICGMNVDQQHQEYHLCQPNDNCMCFWCIREQRVGGRRVGEEGEIQEAVERQPPRQEAVAFNSQQQQFSRMGPTQNCENCNMCIDQQLQEYQHCACRDCCVCLELLDPDRECYTFPCLHTIHRECWDGMLRHELHTCPLCRCPAF